MLTLTFLGTGSAFAKRGFHSNALIEAWSGHTSATPDEVLLVDFGATGPLAFRELLQTPGFEYLDASTKGRYGAITNLFITHPHADHIGGLEELAILGLGQELVPAARIKLFAAEELIRPLWECSLCGGLEVFKEQRRRLEDFFCVVPLRSAEGSYESFCLADRYDFTPFRTDHVRLHQAYDWPSFGLLIQERHSGRIALYSGDTRYDKAILDRLSPGVRSVHEVDIANSNPLHTPLSMLRELPQDIRENMWLYHYDDDWDDARFSFVSREFAGFAPPRVRLTLLD